MSKPNASPENPFLNIAFNIVLPVVVLNQLGPKLGEHGHIYALLIALAIPIAYGIYDYRLRREKNWISLLGLVNVLFTGGFAILKLSGDWFALKEAFFPLLIGIAVGLSNFLSRPFIKTLFWNGQVFDLEKIEAAIAQKQSQVGLEKLFKNATHLFSTSFFLSALLNYVLAKSIFLPIDLSLTASAQDEILNQQIAKMTWQGYIVIALPMMVFMVFILWYFLSGLKKLTGLSTDELLPSKPQGEVSSDSSSK